MSTKVFLWYLDCGSFCSLLNIFYFFKIKWCNRLYTNWAASWLTIHLVGPVSWFQTWDLSAPNQILSPRNLNSDERKLESRDGGRCRAPQTSMDTRCHNQGWRFGSCLQLGLFFASLNLGAIRPLIFIMFYLGQSQLLWHTTWTNIVVILLL